jgi:hypothetical protein
MKNSWFHSWRWCVCCHQHQRTIWIARWKGKCGNRIQNNATFSYGGCLTSLEAPRHWPVVTIAGSYGDSNSQEYVYFESYNLYSSSNW